MITSALHLLACITLAIVSLFWRQHLPEGASIYRHVMPFIIAAGVLGLLVIYAYIMEFFVASYSGSIYEVGGLTVGQTAWIAVSVILTILPIVGLIPYVGRQSLLLAVAACLASVPSVVSLVSYQSTQEAEHDSEFNGLEP